MTSCYAIVRNYTDVRHFANKNLWPDQKQQEQLQQKNKQQEPAQKLALVPELVEDEENGSEDYEGFGALGFCVFAVSPHSFKTTHKGKIFHTSSPDRVPKRSHNG